MIRKLKFWILFVVTGVSVAAESVDAEILKDLDFFSSLDVIQDDVAMDEAAGEVLDFAQDAKPVPSKGEEK